MMAIAKKPEIAKAKVDSFIRKGSSMPRTPGEMVPILIKFPPELLDWLTAEAEKYASPRTSYIVRVLLEHKKYAEKERE